MKKEFWLIALKNLRHRGLRTWLTLLGILIGVMAVVSLIGLGNALTSAINSQFGISSTEVISIQAGGLNSYGPPGSGASTPLSKRDLDAIKDVNNVDLAISRNIVTADLKFNDNIIFGFATNLPYGNERKFVYDTINAKAYLGRLLSESEEDKVLLGNNFYTNKVGLGKPVEPGDKVIIKGKSFEVRGILEKQGSFISDNIILMNEDALNDLFNINDRIDLIIVSLKDKTQINRTTEDLNKALRKNRDVKRGEENFEISTPEASLRTVNQILFSIQIFVIIIALISVFVGAVGIVNTMTTSVVERRKDIGVMKAVGAKNEQIFYIFFIESGLLGLIGGFIGASLGTILSFLGVLGLNIFLGTELSPNIDFVLIGLTLIGSFLVGAVSGIWPAMIAAKQNPVEALKK
jgi:putative ABC transport system permease protein